MKVRIFSYKSFRHYGGREITTTSKIVDAEFCFGQGYTTVVSLNESVFGYPKGHKIAIQNKDIIHP